jgi:hypothetical protein
MSKSFSGGCVPGAKAERSPLCSTCAHVARDQWFRCYYRTVAECRRRWDIHVRGLGWRQYARMICVCGAETLCAMPRGLVSAWLEDNVQCLAASIDGVFDVVSLYGFVKTAVHIGRGEWNAWQRIWKVTLQSFRRYGKFGDMARDERNMYGRLQVWFMCCCSSSGVHCRVLRCRNYVRED